MNNEPVRQLFSYAETGRVLGLERSAIFKRVRDGRIKTVTLPDGLEARPARRADPPDHAGRGAKPVSVVLAHHEAAHAVLAWRWDPGRERLDRASGGVQRPDDAYLDQAPPEAAIRAVYAGFLASMRLNPSALALGSDTDFEIARSIATKAWGTDADRRLGELMTTALAGSRRGVAADRAAGERTGRMSVSKRVRDDQAARQGRRDVAFDSPYLQCKHCDDFEARSVKE